MSADAGVIDGRTAVVTAARKSVLAARCVWISVDQRLVDELTKLRPDRIGTRRHQLGHEDDGEVFEWVHPERGARHPTPVRLARARQHLVGDGVLGDRKSEAEA